MENKWEPMAQRSQQKRHFGHKDMDYYLSWIVGRQTYAGSDPAECLAAASRIADGDPQSWQAEWAQLARRVEDQAHTALSAGDRLSARGAYLRACTYYRAPLFIMNPRDAAFREGWQKLQSCFRKAASLLDPPLEIIEVPFGGNMLQAYFWKVDDSGRKRPTLIVIGGMETFAEDCYFITGPAGPRRGYNVMTADLPGQGVNPDAGLFLEARMEIPLKAVVDYALSRPEVDSDHLAVFGFSWGGHVVLKGAQHDPRIKALIANPPMPDVFRAALAQQTAHGKGDPVGKRIFEQLAWRFGVGTGDILRRLVKGFEYLLFARANCSAIRCPTLCMAGEGEAKVTLALARECHEQLPNPSSKLVILTAEQGGEAHCQVNNLSLLNQVIFDWLDEVFHQGLRSCAAKEGVP